MPRNSLRIVRKNNYSEWPNGLSHFWCELFTRHKHLSNVFILVKRRVNLHFTHKHWAIAFIEVTQYDAQLWLSKYVYGEIQSLMLTICAKLVLTAITHILTISEIYVYPSHGWQHTNNNNLYTSKMGLVSVGKHPFLETYEV